MFFLYYKNIFVFNVKNMCVCIKFKKNSVY